MGVVFGQCILLWYQRCMLVGAKSQRFKILREGVYWLMTYNINNNNMLYWSHRRPCVYNWFKRRVHRDNEGWGEDWFAGWVRTRTLQQVYCAVWPKKNKPWNSADGLHGSISVVQFIFRNLTHMNRFEQNRFGRFRGCHCYLLGQCTTETQISFERTAKHI